MRRIDQKDPMGDEHGAALLASLFALIVIGGLISAAFGPVLLEQRLGQNTRRVTQSFEIAESGIREAFADWDAASWNSLGVSDSAMFSGTAPHGIGAYDGIVRKLNNELFLVDVVGRDRWGGARQRIAHFAKLRLIDFDIEAALTTRGPTRIGGSAEVNGNDQPPSGWACGAPDTTMAGVRLTSEDDLETIGGCSGADCIDGNPPVEADSTINDSTFFQYGDLDWEALTAMASVRLTSTTTWKIQPELTATGQCKTLLSNWGDPTNPASPCFNYFPIVYAPGDLNINGDFGQGILLVEGDLSVQGGFEFYGVTIVKGNLKTTGTGGHFNGAVLAANVDLDDITVLGDALVQYSSCAILRALQATSPGAPLRSRGWFTAY